MPTLMEKVEIVGFIAILATLASGITYVTSLQADVTNLEKEVKSLDAPTVAKQVTQLEDQMRSLDANQIARQVTQLQDQVRSIDPNTTLMRVGQLENQVHSFQASLTSISDILVDLQKRSVVSSPVNPILEKCAELADEANTGRRTDRSFTFDDGPEVIKSALATMQQLGCASVPR